MTNAELFKKHISEMGNKLNDRIDKKDEKIRNIQMSQMSLDQVS